MTMPHIRIITPHVAPVPRKLAEVADIAGQFGVRFSQANITQGPVSIESAFDEALCAPGVVAQALVAAGEGAGACTPSKLTTIGESPPWGVESPRDVRLNTPWRKEGSRVMLGVRLTKSLTLVIAARSMASAEKAVIVSGISFSRSCRMRAVTTISVD